MMKTDTATADVGTEEFFDRAWARLRFDIPPGLTDAGRTGFSCAIACNMRSLS